MKLLLMAASGLLILVGVHYAISGQPGGRARAATEIDPLTTGSISRTPFDSDSPRRYHVLVAGGGKGCILAKGRTHADGTATVHVSPECAVFYPAIENVSAWRDDGQEAVALTDEGGETLLDLTAGDGVAYESWRPAASLVSLVAE